MSETYPNAGPNADLGRYRTGETPMVGDVVRGHDEAIMPCDDIGPGSVNPPSGIVQKLPNKVPGFITVRGEQWNAARFDLISRAADSPDAGKVVEPAPEPTLLEAAEDGPWLSRWHHGNGAAGRLAGGRSATSDDELTFQTRERRCGMTNLERAARDVIASRQPATVSGWALVSPEKLDALEAALKDLEAPAAPTAGQVMDGAGKFYMRGWGDPAKLAAHIESLLGREKISRRTANKNLRTAAIAIRVLADRVRELEGHAGRFSEPNSAPTAVDLALARPGDVCRYRDGVDGKLVGSPFPIYWISLRGSTQMTHGRTGQRPSVVATFADIIAVYRDGRLICGTERTVSSE